MKTASESLPPKQGLKLMVTGPSGKFGGEMDSGLLALWLTKDMDWQGQCLFMLGIIASTLMIYWFGRRN